LLRQAFSAATALLGRDTPSGLDFRLPSVLNIGGMGTSSKVQVDTNQDGAFSLTIGFSTLPPGHYEALAVGGGVRAKALFIFPVAPSPAP
jgi:hypothetical protein